MAFLIDIEGTDGSGKQTQSLKLVDNLISLGHNCFRQSFPNYDSPSSACVQMFMRGEFGDSVYSLDPYQVSSLYAVDRLCTMKQLEKRLDDDTFLVLDRYTYSNVIHNATKIEDQGERDKCISWIEEHEFGVLKLPKPDVVLFLDMPIEKCLEMRAGRQNKNGATVDVFEKDTNYQRHAYEISKLISKQRGWIEIPCVNDDGSIKTIDEIQAEILDVVLKAYAQKQV